MSHAIRKHAVRCILVAALLAASAAHAQKQDAGLYVATPQEVVDAMLEMGGVGARDYVIDLGSGDGRIVRSAARRFGASGVGVEIDPELVALANTEAKKDGVSARAAFVGADLWSFDVSKASVVTVYLLPSAQARLKQKLLAELKPGTRIVSHDYPFPDWPPLEQKVVVDHTKFAVIGEGKATLYLYVVPPKH